MNTGNTYNIGFKHGAQSSLNTLLDNLKNNTATVQAGTFYLTDDTDRLYFAQEPRKLVPLNQFIRSWAQNDLPQMKDSSSASYVQNIEVGDIYYWSKDAANHSKNILMIADNIDANNNVTWTQLNPDTRLNANSTGLTVSTINTNSAKVALEVKDTANTQVTSTITFVPGSNKIQISANSLTKAITIDATDTTYTLGVSAVTDGASINLTPDAGTSSTVSIVGDGTWVSVATNNGAIKVTGTAPIKSTTFTVNNNGEFYHGIKLGNDSEISSTFVPAIAYGSGTATTSAVFAGGTATLDVYTTAQVDAKINAYESVAQAMVYRGVIASATDLTAAQSSALVGNTYKITANSGISVSTGDNTTATARLGDLIVARTVNGSTVYWDVIPSGDEKDYDLDIGLDTGHTVSLKQGPANGQLNTTLNGFTINASTAISDSTSTSGIIVSTTNTGMNKVFEIAHAARNTATGTTVTYASATSDTTWENTGNDKASINIPILAGFKYDTAGHVTGIEGKTYQLKRSSFDISATTTKPGATAYYAISTTFNGVPKTFNLGLKSSSLNVTVDNSVDSGLNVDFVWGEF